MSGLLATSAELCDENRKPYFLWWMELTVGEFRRKLREGSAEDRAYWLGALLREANTRDVWLFTSVREIRELWPWVYRHLGKAGALWSFLLKLSPPAKGGNAA